MIINIINNFQNAFIFDTIYNYIKALKKIFVIEDATAWNPNLRSKTAIRTSDTRYFSDPSVATAALGLGPKDLINDLNTFGLFYETLCVRDLRVYADAIGGTVYHYRDKSNLECDAVVHLRNGSYGLVEIKLGGKDLIEGGAKTLKSLGRKNRHHQNETALVYDGADRNRRLCLQTPEGRRFGRARGVFEELNYLFTVRHPSFSSPARAVYPPYQLKNAATLTAVICGENSCVSISLESTKA